VLVFSTVAGHPDHLVPEVIAPAPHWSSPANGKHKFKFKEQSLVGQGLHRGMAAAFSELGKQRSGRGRARAEDAGQTLPVGTWSGERGGAASAVLQERVGSEPGRANEVPGETERQIVAKWALLRRPVAREAALGPQRKRR